ncbi:ATP-grasp domain-containing protein [Novosphingobium sp. MMS21-SN21R]|uniref:ATP-grasp domain-containing protein n=1 Tax=Novosphingobium sp. MMS21-SN21R TaxID=2969298 RepID=UPI0028844E81|nr:ATP-grasp domain-containing protein [Novosphingobium sp. MMS21-SN21R]MDT0508566.1 ATP-grasp domain-containing protein [Novosphingobium sp. MMS21-SN21R]
MANSVLITGARSAAALDLARDFVAIGWDVHLADCVTSRMARWSHLGTSHHRYPSPRKQPQAFRSAIMQLVTRHNIDLVVPTCEEVFHLAAPALHALLGQRLFAPDLPTLHCLHDKLTFARSCREWGLAAPESHPIDDAAALTDYIETCGDWVFKPRFSRFGDRTLVSPNAETLRRLNINSGSLWLAQQRIHGEEACFQAIARQGRVVAFAAYRSSWRLSGGASYAFEPLDPDRSGMLQDVAATIAARAPVHGQFACDVIFGGQGGPILLECNPRSTSGIHLLAGQGKLAGVIEGATPLAGEVVPGAPRPAFLGAAMWVFGLPHALRTGRLREWRTMLATGSDVISRPDDRAPLAGAMIDAAMFSLKGLARGLSATAATTCDIEWNGEDLEP